MPDPERRLHRVCHEHELPAGSMKLLPLGKYGIGVFNVGGSYHALVNYCPHEGAPLCLGRVRGTTQVSDTAIGGIATVRDGEILRCPWHQWEFEIATGTTVTSPHRAIRTFPVEVLDGEVFLEL